jgi:eukaryotic-like serine/threonine-protein kinase
MDHLPGMLMPGAALGRYELLMPIAQGGMAAVWAARQAGSRGFEKTVAIKTMLPKLSEDPQFERMFLNEATLATRIQHPNVAQILDLGEQGELLYIVLEWVDGEALSTLMRAAEKKGSGLARHIALGVVERACWGLHAAHEVKNEQDESAGIVHRDVSPQNILVAYNGAVKVVDFGVAKASGLPGGETNSGSLKGKVPYMSPEQARTMHIDRRTDVFAMGVLLYRLTTGTLPFARDNDLETLRAIIQESPVPPRQHDPSISTKLERLILRCLEKDREKRFPTMADLADAIGEVGRRITEQEIAAHAQHLTGEKGAARRAALKQAAKSLGWSAQAVAPLSVKEGLSAGEGLLAGEGGQPTPSERGAAAETPPASTPMPEVHVPTPSVTESPRAEHSPTLSSVVASEPLERGPRSKSFTMLAIGAVAVIGGLVGTVAYLAAKKEPNRTAAAPDSAAVSPSAESAKTTTAMMAPATPRSDAVTVSPMAVASSAPSAKPSASVAPTATAAIAPPNFTGTLPRSSAKPATAPPNGAPGGIDMGF